MAKLCNAYLGDNYGTCPQLTCILRHGHSGLCDNVADHDDAITDQELSWLESDGFAMKAGALDAECVRALVAHYRRTQLSGRDREALLYLSRSVPAAGGVADDALALIARLMGGRA